MSKCKRLIKGFLLNATQTSHSVNIPTTRRIHGLALIGEKDTSNSDQTRVAFTSSDWEKVKGFKMEVDHPLTPIPLFDWDNCNDLHYYNTAHGYKTTVDGILPMYFADPRTETPAEQVLTALGTKDVNSITVSIESFDPAGLYNPTIKMVMIYDYANENLGMFKNIYKYETSVASGGNHTFNDTFFNLTKKQAILNSVLWTTSKVSDAKIEINGDVREDTNDTVQEFFNDALNVGGVVPTYKTSNKFYFRDFAGLSNVEGYNLNVDDYSIDVKSSSAFNERVYATTVRGDVKGAMKRLSGVALVRGTAS